MAVAASAALAAGLSPLVPTASAVDVPQETVVPAASRSTCTAARLRTTSPHSGHDAAGARGSFGARVKAASGWQGYKGIL